MLRYAMRGLTHMGYVRPVNTDSWWANPDGRMAAIADGLLSTDDGARSGQRAIAAVQRHEGLVQENPTEESWEQLFEVAHDEVSQIPGSAASLMVFYADANGTGWIGHVGGARCYLLREERIEQITRDHTEAGILTELGMLPPAAARLHEGRHSLVSALGTRSHAPEVTCLSLRGSDRIVLMTDGIAGVADERMLLPAMSAADAPVRLMVASLAMGGPDALTSIVIDVTDR